MNYSKNSVKLLTVIDKYENDVVLYTEFDGNFVVGDKLYVMVIDSGSTEYLKLDSVQVSATTLSNIIGYDLKGKEGNKLILGIDYSGLTSGLTVLTKDNCYIGRVYIKNGTLYSGTINGSLMYDVALLPTNIVNLKWHQGILYKSPPDSIQNIYFNTDTTSDLILKSEVFTDGSVYSYYTINNYGNGLSIINLSNSTLNLVNCNINAGIFNYCDLYTSYVNYITNGTLNNCIIGPKYTVNGGTLNECELYDNTILWLNGTWNSSLTGATNLFRSIKWLNGTWKNGVFPVTSQWTTGRFMKGNFNGSIWLDGSFGTKDSNSDTNNPDTIFGNTVWDNGSFNNGIFSGSTWSDGIFFDGIFSGSTWSDGVFNGGTFGDGSIWNNGTFNNGTISGSTWLDGIFNNGTISSSSWYSGDFNNGVFNGGSIWYDGYFYNGKFTDSTWLHGSFHRGSMFTSNWVDGDLFFGVMNSVNWSGGTWHNGIANNIVFSGGTWMNGVFNYGYFYNGNWYNGSFNSGYFSGATSLTDANWYGGVFYYGEFNGTWYDGTFYTGRIVSSIPQQNIIGREFVQYNKYGLVSNKYGTVRLPSKKKY